RFKRCPHCGGQWAMTPLSRTYAGSVTPTPAKRLASKQPSSEAGREGDQFVGNGPATPRMGNVFSCDICGRSHGQTSSLQSTGIRQLRDRAVALKAMTDASGDSILATLRVSYMYKGWL